MSTMTTLGSPRIAQRYFSRSKDDHEIVIHSLRCVLRCGSGTGSELDSSEPVQRPKVPDSWRGATLPAPRREKRPALGTFAPKFVGVSGRESFVSIVMTTNIAIRKFYLLGLKHKRTKKKQALGAAQFVLAVQSGLCLDITHM